MVGPTPELYGAMMREIVFELLGIKDKSISSTAKATVTLDGETTNRSSIVTCYERPRFDPVAARSSTFSMLFTGDAFDKACDIRDTLASWKVGQTNLSPAQQINVDVLKVRRAQLLPSLGAALKMSAH